MSFTYVGVSNSITGQSDGVYQGTNIDRTNGYIYWGPSSTVSNSGAAPFFFRLALSNFTLSSISSITSFVSSSGNSSTGYWYNSPFIFNPTDGYVYAVTYSNYLIRQFNPATWAWTGKYIDGRTDGLSSILSLALSNDGKTLYANVLNGAGGVSQYASFSLPGLTFISKYNYTEFSIASRDLINDDTNSFVYTAGSSSGTLIRLSRAGALTTVSLLNTSIAYTQLAIDSAKSKLYVYYQKSDGAHIVIEKFSIPGMTRDASVTLPYVIGSHTGHGLGLDTNANYIYLWSKRGSDSKYGLLRLDETPTFDSFILDGATGASAASPLNNEGGVTLDLNNLVAYVPRISSDNGLRVAKFTIDQPPPAPIVIGNVGAGLKKPNNIFDFNRLMGGY